MLLPRTKTDLPFALHILCFTSIACSWRAITSICIILMLVTAIFWGKKPLPNPFKNPFVVGCGLLFVVHLLALFNTTDLPEGLRDIRMSSALIFLPTAILWCSQFDEPAKKKLIASFCAIAGIVSLVCLAVAAARAAETGEISPFFYHSLVSPFDQHAVYFSALLLICIFWLGESFFSGSTLLPWKAQLPLTVFLSLVLLLLSSKIVIGLFIGYLLFFFIRLLLKQDRFSLPVVPMVITLAVTAGAVLGTDNPVSRRFSDLVGGDLAIVKREQFSPAIYFNGLQFRLLHWKFTAEILDENKYWLTGTGPGDAQDFINNKYASTGMYLGNAAKGDPGYLGYNTHNQYLESLLQLGLPGLAVLLFLCFALVRMAWLRRDSVLTCLIILLISWMFTETILETQYGLVIFLFFPLFIYGSAAKNR